MIADLSVMKTFVSVVDQGSVVGAAKALGYSPAAVSRQMGWLQRRLGVRLFVPVGRSIEPTAPALEFVQRCREVVEEVRRFESYARDFASAEGATTQGQAAYQPQPG
ncbi:LysR family transcriptional regulator [Microbacterium sp. NPDC055910]|uniref:LysR family transcriptional regulator n=1 Tax=Microbacterium sp. NPDC055910 TaxID=3345659 RepID=UPI0035DEB200